MNKKPQKRKKKITERASRSYVSGQIQFDINNLEESFQRAELVIENIDCSGFSYEGRVFLNNPDANEETPMSTEYGYAGCYHILGYGGVLQDDFEVERSVFDSRPFRSVLNHKRINVTDILKLMSRNTNVFVISIVPILPGGANVSNSEIVVKLDRIGIVAR